MTYNPSDFHHNCAPGKCKGYIDNGAGLHVPVGESNVDYQLEVVKKFLSIVHATFHQDFNINVLGHEVIFEKHQATIQTKYGTRKTSVPKDILTIKDMLNGDIMLMFDGSKVLINAPSIEKLHSVLKGCSVIIIRKFSPFKALIEPTKSLISRMGELDLVKSMVSDGNDSFRDAGIAPSVSLQTQLDAIVPIGDIESEFAKLVDQGCVLEDIFTAYDVLKKATEINTNNKQMVVSVIGLTNAIMNTVRNQAIITPMMLGLAPIDKKDKEPTIDLPNVKLRFTDRYCVEYLGTENEKTYSYDFDGELLCVEYIPHFNSAISQLCNDNYVKTVSEMYTKLVQETGLSDAVKGYRVTRKRYKKPREEAK